MKLSQTRLSTQVLIWAIVLSNRHYFFFNLAYEVKTVSRTALNSENNLETQKREKLMETLKKELQILTGKLFVGRCGNSR